MVERSLKILIVDDDIDNAASLGELFEFYGHEISVAHNGEAAIEAYVTGSFDITFMDVMLPGKNGVESFLEIRKMKPSAKVVMMTGYSVEQLLRQAMDNGALGVLSKPMEPSSALEVLADVGPTGVVVSRSVGLGARGELLSAIEQSGKRCTVLQSKNEMASFMNTSSDIVIIDLNKPLIEGVGCYTELKRSGLTASAIIFAGAEQDGFQSDDFLKDYRITGILNKPFDPQILMNSVHQLTF